MTTGLVAMGTITDTATATLQVSVKLRIRTSTIGTIITSGKAFTSSRLLQPTSRILPELGRCTGSVALGQLNVECYHDPQPVLDHQQCLVPAECHTVTSRISRRRLQSRQRTGSETQSPEIRPLHRERHPKRVTDGSDNLHRKRLLRDICTNIAQL